MAKRLKPDSTYEYDDYYHYEIKVTYNGQTRYYGGAGEGGGQGIKENQIHYHYLFDGSSRDALGQLSLDTLRNWNDEYGRLDVPKDEKIGEVTWDSVRRQADEGSYIKIMYCDMYDPDSLLYAYVYDDSAVEGFNRDWGNVHILSNTWYDGRYFNNHEFCDASVKNYSFKGSVEYGKNENDGHYIPSVTFKDYVIQLPEGFENYYYRKQEYIGENTVTYHYYKIKDSDQYNAENHTWTENGYVKFKYDSTRDVWVCEDLSKKFYKNPFGSDTDRITNDDIDKQCIFTEEQLINMGVDRNVGILPSDYYIYDGLTTAGTPVHH